MKWILALLFILTIVMPGNSQDFPVMEMLRWEDLNGDATVGFVVHVENDGIVTDYTYMKGDGSMSEDVENVYGVFMEIGPGETHVSVSAFTDDVNYDVLWSEGSNVLTFDPQPPLETSCDKADLNDDGIVGGPDFTYFSSEYGNVCE